MRRTLLHLWKLSQPYLQKPRLWAAHVLRRFLWKTTFIAITGSNGKTTATQFLAAILSSYAPTQWTTISRNGLAGITETIAFCKPWKTRYAVFEVGAKEPGRMQKAARLIRPHIALELSVFLEHRSFLKTLEGVAREKESLLRYLQTDGLAVINADDPLVATMAVPAGRNILRFGASGENEAYYEDVISAWPRLLQFTAVVGGRRQHIQTRLLGTHWVGPILACIATAHHLGVSLDQIARVIKEVPPYPGRMQVVQLPSGAVVIRDEFKASAHTIEAAFDELRKATASRKFLVFCDQSETSMKPRKRLRKIGRSAAEMVDYAIFVGDGSDHGIGGAIAGGLPAGKALGFGDYLAAAKFLKPMLGAGDVVLLKADRGHQLTRLFFSMLGVVRCTLPVCARPFVCDDCYEYRNPELVQLANELTVKAN